VKNVEGTCGGGANNTSVALVRLGCIAGFCGVVGADQWGTVLLENLKKEGVETSHATVIEHETSSFSIVLNAVSGERVILYEPGTNAHLHQVTFDKQSASKMDWIYLNHIQPDSCVIQDDMIEIFDSFPDANLTWNPGGCQIEAGMTQRVNAQMLKHTDLLLLNKEEALAFANTKTITQALHILRETGAGIVCITDGKNGAVACDGTTKYMCPALEAPVVDTTGAGDAFGAAMTWAIATGQNLPTALRAGTINATSVVGAIGAQAGLLTDTEMRQALQQTPLDVQASPF
jgi:ribokinase